MIKDNKDITMAQLAIKGHITRGKEVIEILEMLGGKNKEEYTGENNHLWYYINERDEISIFTHSFDDCNFFTLEEFLEKYPYKVGDKVYYDNKVCDVIEILWNSNLNTISYGVYDGRFKNLAIVEELKSYKKETMETITIDDFKANTKEWLIDKLHGMIISNAIKTIGNIHDELHKSEYPKTYEECCEVLDIESEWHLTFELNNSASCGLCLTKEFEYICKLEAFRKLLICRDAYWKIAGEQMGLDKPWEPDWSTESEVKYVIEVYRNNVRKNSQGYSNTIFAFPTVEMRNAFKENFDSDIEFCKEFL
jgi:hypothetical protein